METAGKKLLEVKDLRVRYRRGDEYVCALNGLDLDAARGEKLGLVGETGAGKTTLALSILGLLPERVGEITGGSIVFSGDELLEQGEAYMLGLRGRRVSMIFQDPMTSLNPVQTVGEQIGEVLKLHFPAMGREERRGRVDRVLNMVGIPASRAGDYPYQFSGGMKQRVVIAMALIAEPELLLADEPTTALDVTIQAQILDMMRRLQEELGTTVLLISHDLGVVAGFCDRVAVMYAGRIVELGRVEQVFGGGENHPYTRGLLRAIPRLDTGDERLFNIEGTGPDIRNMPAGCHFCTRCWDAQERCKTEHPQLVEIEPGHFVACHLAGEGRKEGEAV